MDERKQNSDEVITLRITDLLELMGQSAHRSFADSEFAIRDGDPVPGTLEISVIDNGVPVTDGTNFEYAQIRNDSGSVATLIGTSPVSAGQVAIEIPPDQSGRIKRLGADGTIGVRVEGKVYRRIRWPTGGFSYIPIRRTHVPRKDLTTGFSDAGGGGSYGLSNDGELSG